MARGRNGAEEGRGVGPVGSRGARPRCSEEYHRFRRVRRFGRRRRLTPQDRYVLAGASIIPPKSSHRDRKWKSSSSVSARKRRKSRSGSSRRHQTRGRTLKRSIRSALPSAAKSSISSNYGAFLQLEEGVEGLIHVSEMAWTRRNVAPSRIVNKGQEIEARVLEISPRRQAHLPRT